jgi:hypothetical protein
MSTYEHELLAARFAALAPRPLPGDWHDVLGRAGAVRPRRRRLARSLWRGGRRRKLVVALAVAVLVTAVATAAYGTVRVLFLDKGFIGLPPVGATPSAPESGELVLRWLGRSATHARPHWREEGVVLRPLFRVWVYADGRIIWSEESSQSSRTVPEGANELTTGYLEQRLTPEGVELLRSEVVGLLEGSGIPLETVPTDDEPRRFRVEVRDGDRLVRANWEGTGIATPEQRAARRRVDALLTDTASLLPPSAWAVREIRAYVPSHYEVCMDTSPPKDASQLLSLLPAKAADVLRGKSLKGSEGDLVQAREGGRTAVIGRSATYCTKLTTEEAREVAEPFSGLDQDPRFHGVVVGYRLAEPVANLDPTSIWFEPYFPHGQVTCSACG